MSSAAFSENTPPPRVHDAGPSYERLIPAVRRKAWALVFLGYALPWLFLVTVLGVLALFFLAVAAMPNGSRSLVGAKVGPPLCILAYVLLRGMWGRQAAPEGWRLCPRDNPELFAHIAHVAHQVGVAPPHVVRVDAGFGASVQQRARLGILGWPEKTMTLGYYLLACASEAEVTAVIAHELAHLSHNDSKLGMHAGRVYMSSYQTLERLRERQDIGARLIAKLTAKYLDLFMQSTSTVRRLQELRADVASARITSPCVAGEALVRVAILSELCAAYAWPALWASVARSRQFPVDVADRIVASLQAFWEPHRIAPIVDDLQREVVDPLDSHPSIADRLQALGAPSLPSRYATLLWHAAPAAATLLRPSSLAALKSHLQSHYEEELSDEWSARCANHESLLDHLRGGVVERIAEQETSQGDAPLLNEELTAESISYMVATARFQQASAVARDLLARGPEDPWVPRHD